MTVETSTDDVSDPLVGRTLNGKYRIERCVGGGAMGKVYRATQVLLERTVAIKVLHAAFSADDTFQGRFRREAMAASRLEHPNSVQVLDFGIEPDGLMYIAMEFLSGRDLHRLIYTEYPLPIARIVEIMSQTLAVLAVAHDAGIVHRDLKPENIMLVMRPGADGELAETVKVADFGIAKLAGRSRDPDAAKLTAQGMVTGTPEYMSPEQAQGKDVDGRADLYACGVMLFQMVTRKVPYEGDNAVTIVLKHCTEPVPSARTFRPDCDARLDAVIAKAMSKDPAQRFATAKEMRSALRALIDGPRSNPSFDPRAPTPDAIPAVEAPSVAKREAPSYAATVTALPTTEPTPRRSLRVALAGSILLAAAVAAVAFVRRGPSIQTAMHATPQIAASTSPEPTPIETPLPAQPIATAPQPTTPVPSAPPHAAPVVPEASPAAPRAQRTARSNATASALAHAATTPRTDEAPAPVEPAPSRPQATGDPVPSAPPPEAQAPAHATPVTPATAPAPPPRTLRALTPEEQRAEATNGITHGAIAGRARDAERALADCAVNQARAHGTTPDALHARITAGVRDRGIDSVRIQGDAPYLSACESAVRTTFGGLLPEAEDEEYTIQIDVVLHGVY